MRRLFYSTFGNLTFVLSICLMIVLQQANAQCTASLGSVSVSSKHGGLVKTGSNNYTIASGDSVVFTATGFVLPPNGGAGCTPSFAYAIFSQDPTANMPFNATSLLSAPGYMGVDFLHNGITGDWNNNGYSNSLLGGGNYNVVWYVPLVIDCGQSNQTFQIDAHSDNCYVISSIAYKVTYLPPASCNANAGTTTITGNGVVNAGLNSYNLDFDSTAIISSINYTLPASANLTGTCVAGVMYAIYTQDPTSYFPLTSNNYSTIPGYLTASPTTNGVTNDQNALGVSQSATALGLGSYNNLWFVPFTVDCQDDGTGHYQLDNNGDNCFAFGATAVKIHYLPAPPITPICETDKSFTNLVYANKQFSFAPTDTVFYCNSLKDTIYKNIFYAADSIGHHGVEDLTGFYLRLNDSTGSMAQSSATILVNGQPYDYYGPTANYPVGGGLNWGPFVGNSYNIMEPYIPAGATVSVKICSNNNRTQHFAYYFVDYATGKVIQSGGILTARNSCQTLTFTIAKPYMKWTLDGDSTIITNLNNGSASFNPSSLSPGVHTITYTFNNNAGCTLTATQKITVKPGAVASLKVTQPTCGNSNGSIVASASGGTAPYTYKWSNNATGSTITGLSGATYTVTVTDAKACSSTATATINNSTIPQAIIQGYSNVACFNGANGTGTVTAISGTAPYAYTWAGSNGSVAYHDSAASKLAAGTYTVTVTDANSCTATATLAINQPNAYSFTPSTLAANCGQKNGVATVLVTGATAPYSYNWAGSNGSVTYFDSSATGLSSGVYTLTVTDNNGCAQSTTVAIGNKNGTNVTIKTLPNVLCFGGTSGAVVASISGGILPYTYSWSNGITGVTHADTSSVSGLLAGNYSLVVADSLGCAANVNFSIGQPSKALSIKDTIYPAACGNSVGWILATPSGGTANYTYSWSNDSTTAHISGLNAGNYTLTVTDANACTQSITAVISPTSVPQTLIQQVTSPKCFNGNDGYIKGLVNLFGTPPFTYAWSGGTGILPGTGDSLIGLTVGNYTVTVTDYFGCTATNSVLINNKSASALTVKDSVNPYIGCQGGKAGSIYPIVTGGTQPYIFNWANNDTAHFETGLQVGYYTYSVTDQWGCQIVHADSVKNAPLVNALTLVQPPVNIHCFGDTTGTLIANVIGGVGKFTYQWTKNNNPIGRSQDTLYNLGAGVYAIIVTDTFNCQYNANTTVSQPLAKLQANIIPAKLACGKDTTSISIAVAGGTTGYSYSWNTGNLTSTLTGAGAGNYQAIVTDAHGCRDTVQYNLPKNQPITAQLSAFLPPTCRDTNGVAAVQNIAGGLGTIHFTWAPAVGSHDSIYKRGLSSGQSVQVVLTDSLGCVDTLKQTMPVTIPSIAINNANANDTICNGSNDNLMANITGGTASYTYNWSDNTTGQNDLVSPTSNATYTLTVTDALSCSTTQTISVLVQTLQLPNIIASATSTCDSTTGFVFTIPQLPNGASVIWNFGSKQITAGSPYTYTFPTTGLYPVSASVTLGKCASVPVTLAASAQVAVNPQVNAQFTYSPADPTPLLTTTPISFTNTSVGSGNATARWSFLKDTANAGADSVSLVPNPTHQFLDPGTYCVRLTETANQGGCVTEITQCLDIHAVCNFPTKVPNVFSPNDDGKNDHFEVTVTGFGSLTCNIFNRWGEQVATFDGINGRWDGKDKNGQNAPVGTYYYLFEGKCEIGGKKVQSQGFIELMR